MKTPSTHCVISGGTPTLERSMQRAFRATCSDAANDPVTSRTDWTGVLEMWGNRRLREEDGGNRGESGIGGARASVHA
jgi:hypothetical protein